MKPIGQQSKRERTTSKNKVNKGTHCIKARQSNLKDMRNKHKIAGKDDNYSREEEKSVSHSNPTLHPKMEASSLQLATRTSTLKQDLHLRPLQKFRLQLFPTDYATCKGLEKDGHNPYLELTLGLKKKISSVVKHLTTKWGNSSVAVGELVLFPYEGQLENLAINGRWSLDDTSTTAADVYIAVGSPTIFRLRYGWFPNEKSGTAWVISEDQDMVYTVGKENMFSRSTTEHGLVPTDDCLKLSMDRASYLDNFPEEEAKLKSDCNTNVLLDCNLTNMNFEDILARISSTTKDASQCGHLTVKKSSCLAQIPFTCDSFDAAIASHVARNQAPNSPIEVSKSSIFDAEETCHAFSLQKNSSSPEVSYPHCLEHPIAQPQQYTHISEEHQRGLCKEVSISKEPATDLRPQVHLQNSNESSLGLASINWDSLGPLELGMPPKQMNGDQSISFSALLGTSRDASRSCSLVLSTR